MNPHLSKIDCDYLYHLGLTSQDAPLFKNVEYVCIGGSNGRMSKFAESVAETLGLPKDEVKKVGKHIRYVTYLVGPVLVCSHGMGGPSISILLHEIAKLLKYAEADAVWIRIGTCGGIGFPAGTVIVSTQSLNGALEPFQESLIMGEIV
jgi:uridine phosphorylase